MEPFATLTVDRGDRPQLLEFCRHQIDRFTIQPKHKIFVVDPPTSDKVDLVMRMRKGITAAKNFGIDLVFVIESDDYYAPDHIERLYNDLPVNFWGASRTIYYNVFNKSYTTHNHPTHSSLFCTAFRISALENFIWPSDNTIFLDIDLWRHAIKRNSYWLDANPIGVGIKHGIGKCAGNGHKHTYENIDTSGEYLKSLVDKEAYAFYRSL